MTIADFALAVTVGSIIGMTCIMVREYRLREAAERKLARFDRIRNSKGRFTKKGGA